MTAPERDELREQVAAMDLLSVRNRLIARLTIERNEARAALATVLALCDQYGGETGLEHLIRAACADTTTHLAITNAMPEVSDRTMAALRRDIARADALAPVLALHRRMDGAYPYCAECDHNWPCATAAATGEPTP